VGGETVRTVRRKSLNCKGRIVQAVIGKITVNENKRTSRSSQNVSKQLLQQQQIKCVFSQVP
jgi:deoxycytidylate deaminase